MEFPYRWWARALLVTAACVIAEPAARAWERVVFQALNFPGCGQPGPWKAIGGLITGAPLGFTSCAGGDGLHGHGASNDPYRLVLDGQGESIAIDGLEITTRADYTVELWFRVTRGKKGLMMLVDSRKDAFYIPLRMMISNGILGCTIEMPFPDRIYRAVSSAPIASSRWQHAACRFRAQSRELSLFWNGKLTASTRVPPGSIRSDRIRIGADPSSEGENFAGEIAQVVFSQKADDASTIQTRCQAESQRFAGAACTK